MCTNCSAYAIFIKIKIKIFFLVLLYDKYFVVYLQIKNQN